MNKKDMNSLQKDFDALVKKHGITSAAMCGTAKDD